MKELLILLVDLLQHSKCIQKSGGALKELIENKKKEKRSFYEDRLDALRKSVEKARAELSQQEGSEKSVSSENVYGQ